MLKRVGLLERARTVKRKLAGPPRNDFKPGDPRTLVSTAKCLQWLQEAGLAEGSDYLEFGIFRGFNLWFVQAMARLTSVEDMRFFGFDSFFGLPPITGIDRGGPFEEGEFSVYREEVERYFTRFGVDWEKTFLVEGFFDASLTPETKAKHSLRRCSLCVVDCDLYSSTVSVLNFVEPLLGNASLLYFDDWQDFGGAAERGEPKAFAEFMVQNGGRFEAEPFPDLVALGGKGKAFIMRRRSA
jgi:O-methyltransferase